MEQSKDQLIQSFSFHCRGFILWQISVAFLHFKTGKDIKVLVNLYLIQVLIPTMICFRKNSTTFPGYIIMYILKGRDDESVNLDKTVQMKCIHNKLYHPWLQMTIENGIMYSTYCRNLSIINMNTLVGILEQTYIHTYT